MIAFAADQAYYEKSARFSLQTATTLIQLAVPEIKKLLTVLDKLMSRM